MSTTRGRTSDEAIERRLIELREKAAQYAEAQGTRVYLEHFIKSKLAILQKRYMGLGHDSVAAQEREARSNEEYLQVLEALKVATSDAERLRWELRIAEHGIDIFRTREATRRAEQRGYGT